FVPPIIGLRNGLLFMEWLDAADRNGEDAAGDGHLKTLSSYIARRVQRLRLQEDPCFANPDYRWTGWHELVQLLRGAYGPYIGRLKSPALCRQLARYASPMPTLLDGRMKPEDWIETNTGRYKIDFEHHNFGGAELNL